MCEVCTQKYTRMCVYIHIYVNIYVYMYIYVYKYEHIFMTFRKPTKRGHPIKVVITQ